MDAQTFYNLYRPNQYGSGEVEYYRPNLYRQRGSGIGSIFSSIGRRLIPILKKYILPAAKDILIPHAKDAFRNFTTDVLNEDRNVLDSFKDRSRQALNKIKSSVVSKINQSGSGRKRKRRRKIGPKKSRGKSQKSKLKKLKKRKTNKKKGLQQRKTKRKPVKRKRKTKSVKTIFD